MEAKIDWALVKRLRQEAGAAEVAARTAQDDAELNRRVHQENCRATVDRLNEAHEALGKALWPEGLDGPPA